MTPIREKTVQVRLNFPDRHLVRPVLEGFRSAPAVGVKILRGRMTQKKAYFELEIFGAARRIDEFLKWSARRGASIRARSAVGA